MSTTEIPFAVNAHQECALRRLATGAATQQIKHPTRMALIRRNLITPGVGIDSLTASGRRAALASLRELKACHDSHGLTFPGNNRAITALEALVAA